MQIQFNGLRYNLIGHFTFSTTLRKTMSKQCSSNWPARPITWCKTVRRWSAMAKRMKSVAFLTLRPLGPGTN
ncbi:hypothetical protein Q3G72_012276 [Acer saccharum]|nr:hypothetical protein Q3G72_012276 [Acer saccharum]